MKKNILIGTLTVLAISSVVYANGIQATTNKEITSVDIFQENTDVEKDIEIENSKLEINDKDGYSNLVINENLSGANGSATYSFSVSEDQSYYEVFISNNGKSSIAVVVEGNSYIVEAGKEKTIIFATTSYDRRNIDITSKDGSALSGSIAVKIASALS